MPLPLREPFFLKGRTSVVQRAVIMSVVLGGLVAVASWVIAGYPLLILVGHGLFEALFWGVALGGVIYGPLNYWNRRNIWHTLAAIGLAASLQYGLQSGLFSEILPTTVSAPIRYMLPHLAVACGNGFLQLRLTRLHLIACVVTILWAAVPINHSYLLDLSTWLWRGGVPFLASRRITVAVYCCIALAPLAIPWGIPFWWPPEKDGGNEVAAP